MNMNSKIKNVEVGTVYVDAIAEAAVIDMLASIFNGIAYIDADTVRYNIERACEGGFAREDRSISMELADWLMYNFSLIVVNGRFCPQSVRNFCPIVAGFNAGTYKVPACVL